MQSSHLVMEEPVRLASILESSKSSSFSSMTKIIATIGPTSRSVATLEALLNAGMSVARFDFSWKDADYHQESVDNLRQAARNTKKLCAVMLDTIGPELRIVNHSEKPIELQSNDVISLTPDQSEEPSSKVLPINYPDLALAVKPGDTIFIGKYLFTGSETTSVWLEVIETKAKVVVCRANNTATLTGALFTAHASNIQIALPTLSEDDKSFIASWGVRNTIDFVSLSYTRHADDVRAARAHLAQFGGLQQTEVFAKIENVEGLKHFDEILNEADGVILSRGNLGIELPAEKVFLFQKAALRKCNMAGKPAVITRVVDTMTDALRPTRAEATDVANAVLDGTDAIILGAETFRGLFPIQAVKTIQNICIEAEKVYNYARHFKRASKFVGEPITHLESIAASTVRAATNVKASIIIVFTTCSGAARLIAKYKPSMPVLVVVIPILPKSNVRWSFSGTFEGLSPRESQTTILSSKAMLVGSQPILK